MNELKKDYLHLTVIPETNTLYVGKSDYVDLPEKVEPFIKEDLTPFYINLNSDFRSSLNKLQLRNTR